MSRPIKNAGSLDDARLVLWRAIRKAERALDRADESEDNDGVLRAVHAISQATASYRNLVETTDLEKRLQALEREAPMRRTV